MIFHKTFDILFEPQASGQTHWSVVRNEGSNLGLCPDYVPLIILSHLSSFSFSNMLKNNFCIYTVCDRYMRHHNWVPNGCSGGACSSNSANHATTDIYTAAYLTPLIVLLASLHHPDSTLISIIKYVREVGVGSSPLILDSKPNQFTFITLKYKMNRNLWNGCLQQHGL